MIGHSAAESGFIPVRDIPGLIALLDRSEVGTFVLDEIVSDALCKSKFRTCIAGLPDEQGGLWMYEFDGHAPSSALRVTQSLDAALALAERVLPGCGWSVSMDDRMGWYQSDIGKDHYLFAGEPSRSLARTPALALCIAILKAIQHARSSTAGYEAAGEVSPNLKAKAQGEGG